MACVLGGRMPASVDLYYFCAMFFKVVRNALFIFTLVFVISSCSDYNKVLKSNDIDYKYNRAVEYYEKGEYAKALSLFDELGTLLRGTSRSEAVHGYIAECHFNLKDNYFAAYYYKNNAKSYPNSPKAEEALFKSAYCSYLNSPNYSLDQRETEQAIEEFQLFLNRYPKSTLKDSTNTMIAELRSKLESKAFENARLYYQTENYKSATVALNTMLREFPESPHREEIEFLIVKSNYLLAINSVDAKKEERFNATIEAYHKFVDDYGSTSKLVKEAEVYYANSVRELDKIKF